jgi:hypothetical protein
LVFTGSTSFAGSLTSLILVCTTKTRFARGLITGILEQPCITKITLGNPHTVARWTGETMHCKTKTFSMFEDPTNFIRSFLRIILFILNPFHFNIFTLEKF